MFKLTKPVAWQGAFFLGPFVLLFLVVEGCTCKASPFGPSPYLKRVPPFASPLGTPPYRKRLPPFGSFSDLSDSKPQEVNTSSDIISYQKQSHIFQYPVFLGKAGSFDEENTKRHQDRRAKKTSPPPDSFTNPTTGT